mmetsp:Transcript_20398/g.61492  ORF Transcript_20398/g.61492 Transcript_20398/m.61492 type:complete len:270 (-) Transcript_20398:76-885(-)
MVRMANLRLVCELLLEAVELAAQVVHLARVRAALQLCADESHLAVHLLEVRMVCLHGASSCNEVDPLREVVELRGVSPQGELVGQAPDTLVDVVCNLCVHLLGQGIVQNLHLLSHLLRARGRGLLRDLVAERVDVLGNLIHLGNVCLARYRDVGCLEMLLELPELAHAGFVLQTVRKAANLLAAELVQRVHLLLQHCEVAVELLDLRLHVLPQALNLAALLFAGNDAAEVLVEGLQALKALGDLRELGVDEDADALGQVLTHGAHLYVL